MRHLAPNLGNMTTRSLRALVLVLCLVVVAALPASGASKMKRVGEDPAGDGYPALDLTYVEVGRTGADLEIRLGVDGMLPVIGGYPAIPGIEWLFESKGRVFLAEAYVEDATPAFLLFEKVNDSYSVVGDIEGTYDSADGYISMLVPLKTIGAKPGTKIKGHGENDADAHLHIGPQTIYPDTLTTTKSFTVPR